MSSISITTICLNAHAHLGQCVGSVAAQSNRPDEYLIVDGGSLDGTIELIENAHKEGAVTGFISEPDDGISDAFNKAWRMAQSEYVACLNADDSLTPDYIERLRKMISDSNPDIIISNIYFGDDTSGMTITPQFAQTMPPSHWRHWAHPAINHPGMVIRKSLLEKVGGYNAAYSVAMDVDLFYKCLKYRPKIAHINKVLVYQGNNGVSQTSWRRALCEMRQIEIEHGRNPYAAVIAYYFRLAKKLVKTSLTMGRS